MFEKLRIKLINFAKAVCRFNIIISKTTLNSIEFLEDFKNFQKGFKDKIEK
jgi:hypothetical protein